MPVEPERVSVGVEAPDFSLESPGHGIVTLGHYRGRDQLVPVFLRGFG
jgi:peroxiredoxin